MSGCLLGSTAGAVCGLVLGFLSLLLTWEFVPLAWTARVLVLRSVMSAVAGSLAGLLWGGVLGLTTAATDPQRRSRSLIAFHAWSSGLVGFGAGEYCGWLTSSDSSIMAVTGGALGLLSGVWGSRRLLRVL
jgi:hypothetical protein